jgi:hypothetical protein
MTKQRKTLMEAQHDLNRAFAQLCEAAARQLKRDVQTIRKAFSALRP